MVLYSNPGACHDPRILTSILLLKLALKGWPVFLIPHILEGGAKEKRTLICASLSWEVLFWWVWPEALPGTPVKAGGKSVWLAQTSTSGAELRSKDVVENVQVFRLRGVERSGHQPALWQAEGRKREITCRVVFPINTHHQPWVFWLLYSAQLQDLGITCCTCGRGQMIFGDILLCSLHCTWFHLLGACSHLHRLDCVKWCTPSLIAGLVCLMKL